MFNELFDRVEKKYGFKARVNLAENMFKSLPEHTKHIVKEFGKTQDSHPTKWHESRLSGIDDYLSNPDKQRAFHFNSGHTTKEEFSSEEERPVNHVHVSYLEHMGQALEHLKKLAPKIDKNWLKGAVLHKTEESFSLNVSDITNIFYAIGEYAEKYSPEFESAKILADGYIPSDDEVIAAIKEHEGDFVSIALMSHNIPVTPENKDKLMEMCVLKKTTRFTGFKELGVENRRETPIISDPQALSNKQKLLVHATGASPKSVDTLRHGVTAKNPNSGLSWVAATNLSPNTPVSQHPKNPQSVKEHEDFHVTMRHLERKHGPQVKNDIIHGLWENIPNNGKKALSEYLSYKTRNTASSLKTPEQAKEEAVAYVFNYLNNPAERTTFHKRIGEKYLTFNRDMKQAFRAIQDYSSKVKIS
jgi:ribosomal protein S12